MLARLQAWPQVSGAKPLSGKLAGRWRIRTGDSLELVCVLDTDEHGNLTVFITIY